MFKKGFKTSQSSQLKSSEARKLKEVLLKRFVNIVPAELDSIWTSKAKISRTKVTNSYLVIYYLQNESFNEPFLIDLDGRDNFCPTVYALWVVPSMLPFVEIHSGVFKYLQNGADLMFPGVRDKNQLSSQPFKKHDYFSIRLRGNQSAVAVGKILVDTEFFKQNSVSGKCMENIHFFGDTLWELGSKTDFPLSNEQEYESDDDKMVESTQVPQLDNMGASNENSEPVSTEHPDNTNNNLENMPSQESNQGTLTNEELLEHCFLYSLKHIKDKELPILLSLFYSNYMLPSRPVDTVLDIKKTKYKKISQLFAEAEEQELVKTSEVSSGVIQLVSINRKHPKLVSFKSRAFKTVKDEELLAKQTEIAESQIPPLVITELVKPPSSLTFLLTEDKEDKLFTFAEIKSALQDYIQKNNLTHPQNKGSITFDSTLSKVWPNVLQCEKRDLFEKLEKKCQFFYQIQKGEYYEVRKGKLGENGKLVKINVEKRQGGKKHVTHISGLEYFGIVPESLCGEFSKLFAASTTTQDLPGKIAFKEVLVQGAVQAGVASYLIEKIGVPKKYIELQEK